MRVLCGIIAIKTENTHLLNFLFAVKPTREPEGILCIPLLIAWVLHWSVAYTLDVNHGPTGVNSGSTYQMGTETLQTRCERRPYLLDVIGGRNACRS